MRSRAELRRRSVFVNVPFDNSYERLFVALISALVAVGRIPRCVVEIPDQGDGRLRRLLGLIRSCSISVHDLSRVGRPARFNMPFELGIAFAVARVEGNHKFVVFESKRYRLQMTLSDLNGIDPSIHGATAPGMISAVLAALGKPGTSVDPREVQKIYRLLWRVVPALKRRHARTSIYSRTIFQDLVAAAAALAAKAGTIT